MQILDVAAGSPVGNYYRRHWIPVCLAYQVREVGGEITPVKVLGEDLIVFRGHDDKVALVEAYCSHLFAALKWARNEEGGIRCSFHGWKFNTCGELVEVPGRDDLPRASDLVSYPTRVAGGLVWTFMGDPDSVPEFPDYGWLDESAAPKAVEATFAPVDIFQLLESRAAPMYSAADSNASIEIEDHESGVAITVVDGTSSPRVWQYVLPGILYEPATAGGSFFVPGDETRGAMFTWRHLDDASIEPEGRVHQLEADEGATEEQQSSEAILSSDNIVVRAIAKRLVAAVEAGK